MTQSCNEIANELAGAATQLMEAGMMRVWSGQLSARCTQTNGYSVVLKRSGGIAANPTDYCQVDSNGENPEPAEARSSLVTRVHCAIYTSCPNVHAAVQCRGLYADAVSVVLGEIPLSMETFWEMKTAPKVLGADLLRSDTFDQYVDRMAVEVGKALVGPGDGTTAVCVPFYGMWVTGTTIAEAAGRAIALEELAKSAYLRLSLASSLGLPKPDFPPWFGDMLQKLRRPRAL